MDIALFNDQERPICVIEVKRKWDNTQCKGDLERLCGLVVSCSHQRGGSLERGFLTLLLQESVEKGKIKRFVQNEFTQMRAKFTHNHDGVKIRFHDSKRKDQGGLIPFSIEISGLNA